MKIWVTATRLGLTRATLIALLTTFALSAYSADRAANAAIAVVPEMERPEGIRADRKSRRQALSRDARGQQGIDRLRGYLTTNWRAVRGLDVVGMSRYHVDATRGWQIPTAPSELEGRVIAEKDGAFYIEIKGPRLPASFAIVHRHLTFYARYLPVEDKLDRITATIRLEVQE